ncbi:YegS/Rv2252/BmrU family lipid kinase [Caldalkalibacillus uzonensis]|uniref:YegS/Rv2252/BmrU family lipid kinase n=1 Tax=Caldalkalibacillus uzonensis TaxID=353224 RepID=A0ABU0CVS1_9BACI|nr:diacylglycerol kinase family protein [Caldalkalibacillus uzonensis]MDQ0340424.1 YegS/Rv2252/BmrU family lipid kinase [Caldalkalibacillus uzonensis]
MYIFIVNPVSGNGKGLKIWKKVRKELDKRQVPYRSFFTKQAGHGTELAKQLAELYQEKITAIIAVGGDGTVHEIINGLSKYPRIPFSAISAGSGNDFARGFGLPRRPLPALNHILATSSSSLARYDMGVYHLGHKRKGKGYFINGIGVGFDGEVAKYTNQARYKKWLNTFKLGILAYVISALKLLFKYRTQEVIIRVDGQEYTFRDVWLVAICNIPYYGGGMKIIPQARPNDGLLNVCVVHQLKPWQVMLALGSVYLGWHTRLKAVKLIKGEMIQVSSEEPMTVHADGEIIGTSPILLTIEKRTRTIWR